MATSYRTFVDRIASMSVVGVVRKYDHEPSSIGSADLPASFPRFPQGREEGWTPKAQGGWPTLTCEFVILISPWNLGTTEEKWDDTIDLQDNLTDALRGSELAAARTRWTIRAERIFAGNSLYHAVVATIESNG